MTAPSQDGQSSSKKSDPATTPPKSKKEKLLREIEVLVTAGFEFGAKHEKGEDTSFHVEYQNWYTKALRVIQALAPDRLAEFRGYYDIDPKRKQLGYGTYVIQDYMKNVVPSGYQYQDFDAKKQAIQCFTNQLLILNSVQQRAASIISNIEAELYSEIQDNEVDVARKLILVSPRAAGALMGVLIEGHLQKVAAGHGVKISKPHPTIADLNDPLKAAGLIDVPTWRKITYFADIRNLCSHKKGTDPTTEQVSELIDGAEWLTKNVF